MAIIIIPDDQTRPPDKTSIIESLIRDIVTKHGRVESVEPVRKARDWLTYRVSGPAPMLVQFHSGLAPIDKEAVTAFFGEFKLAQIQEPNMGGILISIGSSASISRNSARSHLQLIKTQSPGDTLYLYDAEDLLDILCQQGKALSVRQVTEWVQRESGAQPESCDLILTPRERFWLIELGSQDRSYIALEPTGALLNQASLDALPWNALNAIIPECSLESVVNEEFNQGQPTATLMPDDPASSHDGLLEFLSQNRKLRDDLEIIERAGRRLVCPERGDSVCSDFERLVLTFFDKLSPHDLGATGKFQKSASTKLNEIPAMIAALQLASLYLSAGWIHPDQRRAVGRVEDFARQAVSKAPVSPWASAVPDITTNLVKAVSYLSGSDVNDSDKLSNFDVIAALCIHLGAAFGPYCTLYRSTIYHNLIPDAPPVSTDAPLLEDAWTDNAAQVLKIVLDTPTPRVHRQVTTNRILLQTVLERSEDELGKSGTPLSVTRIQITTRNMSFEVIDCYFELESERVLRIFMGEELYGSKDVWVRELLQNAIDATLLRKALLGEEDFRPKITIFHDRERREIQVIDNGIGMSLYHVRKFFSKVGRSYYRSAELEDELKRKNRKFNAISRFGVGFLSVFMAADSVEILTFHHDEEKAGEGLNIYIPALMEDFYIRQVSGGQPGTTVILQLKNEMEGSIVDLVRRYFICPDVEISIIENGREVAVIRDELPAIVPHIVAGGEWTALFDLISVRISGASYEGIICLPLPKLGSIIGERRADFLWQKAPKNRVALAQAGIWVRDDENSLFGEHRGHGDAYHPFFSRVYGIINFQPGALNINVSRNEFVLNETAREELKKELLSKTSAALVARLESAAQRSSNVKERNDYLRAALFGAIEDGEHYYGGRRESAATYRYSNSPALTSAMAGIYARHMVLDQRTAGKAHPQTLSDIVRLDSGTSDIYISFAAGIEEDPLFNAWMTEQPDNTRMLSVKTKREAALLYRALQQAGHLGNLRELKRDDLRASIRYHVIPSTLDNHLRACAGVVQFDSYKPSTAILVVPVSERTVSKGMGLAVTRSNCAEPPYVLIDRQHWLAEFLMQAADLALRQEALNSNLREICDLLILNVALGATNDVRKEGMQAANNWLTRLYAAIEGLGKGKDWKAVQNRSMLVMSEIIGSGRRHMMS